MSSLSKSVLFSHSLHQSYIPVCHTCNCSNWIMESFLHVLGFEHRHDLEPKVQWSNRQRIPEKRPTYMKPCTPINPNIPMSSLHGTSCICLCVQCDFFIVWYRMQVLLYGIAITLLQLHETSLINRIVVFRILESVPTQLVILWHL